jgi:4-hydroxybenzoate polyprenyltransferase
MAFLYFSKKIGKAMKRYLSMIKFSHTIFALPFAILGFTLGSLSSGDTIDWILFAYVLLCMVFARSAAMSFNRYIDRDIDEANPRTAVREIPSGVISPRSALLFTLFNCLAFIVVTAVINSICFYLSPVALAVVLGYSYTKRFTFLCHLILGLGLSLAPVGAYLAVTGQFDWIPVLLGVGVLFWVAGFDIIYALQDSDFDKEKGLFSIPSFFGKSKALIISRFLHALCALALSLSIKLIIEQLGLQYGFGLAGLAVFCTLLLYQHSLIKANDLSKVNLAFFTTNGIASIVFTCILVVGLYLA